MPYPKYLDDLVKSRNIDHFKQIVFAINEQVERLHNIYGWNLIFFPQYKDKGYYSGPDIEYLEIFDQNKDIFYDKNFSTYSELVIDNKKIENAIKNFKIKNWIDLNKYSHLLLMEYLYILPSIDIADPCFQNIYSLHVLLMDEKNQRLLFQGLVP